MKLRLFITIFIFVVLFLLLACNKSIKKSNRVSNKTNIKTEVSQSNIIVNVISKELKSISDDERCKLELTYPQIEGLPDTAVQNKINKILKYETESNVKDCERGFEEIVNYTTNLNRNNILSITINYYAYWEGAAHPQSSSTCHNFDIKNGQELKLKDLINPDSLKTLSSIADGILKKEKNTDKLSDLGFFIESIDLTGEEDFYITETGIVLSYDAYEIASYATGPIEINIPFSLIENLLLRKNKS
jgi:hypothetical protein